MFSQEKKSLSFYYGSNTVFCSRLWYRQQTPPISHRKNKMQKSARVMQLRPVSYIWLSSVTEWQPIEK